MSTPVNIRIQANKPTLHLFYTLFNIILRTPPVLTSRLLSHITNCCGPLIVAIKATHIRVRASDARGDCCSLCRTDCSFSGWKYPNCKAPWQASVWSTASVPRHSSRRLRKTDCSGSWNRPHQPEKELKHEHYTLTLMGNLTGKLSYTSNGHCQTLKQWCQLSLEYSWNTKLTSGVLISVWGSCILQGNVDNVPTLSMKVWAWSRPAQKAILKFWQSHAQISQLKGTSGTKIL